MNTTHPPTTASDVPMPPLPPSSGRAARHCLGASLLPSRHFRFEVPSFWRSSGASYTPPSSVYQTEFSRYTIRSILIYLIFILLLFLACLSSSHASDLRLSVPHASIHTHAFSGFPVSIFGFRFRYGWFFGFFYCSVQAYKRTSSMNCCGM
ncbi:hypothetical protein DFH06DRAFT_1175665 [Mycena polygramma]|nr:hypothetical protein DFH06DRAFT_1175665 [Mycena polygramma]